MFVIKHIDKEQYYSKHNDIDDSVFILLWTDESDDIASFSTEDEANEVLDQFPGDFKTQWKVLAS